MPYEADNSSQNEVFLRSPNGNNLHGSLHPSARNRVSLRWQRDVMLSYNQNLKRLLHPGEYRQYQTLLPKSESHHRYNHELPDFSDSASPADYILPSFRRKIHRCIHYFPRNSHCRTNLYTENFHGCVSDPEMQKSHALYD